MAYPVDKTLLCCELDGFRHCVDLGETDLLKIYDHIKVGIEILQLQIKAAEHELSIPKTK